MASLYHMIPINLAILLDLFSIAAILFVVASTVIAATIFWIVIEKPVLSFKRHRVAVGGPVESATVARLH